MEDSKNMNIKTGRRKVADGHHEWVYEVGKEPDDIKVVGTAVAPSCPKCSIEEVFTQGNKRYVKKVVVETRAIRGSESTDETYTRGISAVYRCPVCGFNTGPRLRNLRSEPFQFRRDDGNDIAKAR